MFGAFKFLELHQEAALTHIHVQRIEGLHLVELRWLQPRFSKGRHTQVYESMLQNRSTKPTTTLSHIPKRHYFFPILISLPTFLWTTKQYPECIPDICPV